MTLEINRSEAQGQAVTLALKGEIDSQTSQELDEEISKIIAEGITTIVLDMKDVSFISSAGVGVTVKARASLQNRRGELGMVNLQPQVKKVFEIIRLLPTFKIFESVEELDRYLRNIQERIAEGGSFTEDD